MPRKHLDRYSRVKPCISFFSVRNQVPMFCESNTERDLLIDLEFDPTVRAYRTQPATFRYTIRGQQRRYTPDLLILDRDTGFRYEEMKTAAEAETPKFRKKFGYLQHLFRTRLRVPLELRIGRAPEMKQRTANRRWLYGYLQCAIDQVWLQALPPTGTRILYGDAVALLTRTGGSAASVLTLIAHGLLQFDVSSPLGNDTQLEVRNV